MAAVASWDDVDLFAVFVVFDYLAMGRPYQIVHTSSWNPPGCVDPLVDPADVDTFMVRRSDTGVDITITEI